MPDPVESVAPTVEVRSVSIGARGALRIAIADADTGFVRVLEKRIQEMGWSLTAVASADPGRLGDMRLTALVFDPAALEPDPWQVLEELGRKIPELAVVVAAGPSSVADRVRGLHLGADDWITKPCHPQEVIARIEAIVRRRRGRTTAGARDASTSVGELELRGDMFQAFVGAHSVDLTRREFELLLLLVGAAGSALQREEIYQRIWGYTMARGDRSVDVFVRKVRAKLERASPEWDYIHTHFGVGYRFQPTLRGETSDGEGCSP